jgi:nicotinate-nucleotide--dimethylbenzimidazole phosphoribosyltransferase
MADTLHTVIAEVDAPSETLAAAARERLSGRDGLGRIGELAVRLAAIRGSALAPVDRKMVIACAADHGCAPDASAAAAAAEIASGSAVVNVLARSAGAQVTVVDCGVRDPVALPEGVARLAVAPGTADIGAGPAMSRDHAVTALETGIALVLTLGGSGLDAIALGQVGDGGPRAASALVDALASELSVDGAVDVLARTGGLDLGVMAGACVAASAMRIPIVLDGAVAPAAALLAMRLAPHVAGHVIAGHAGVTDADRTALGVDPLLDLHIAAPGGAGAAAALPVLDAASRLLREPAANRRLRMVRDD